MKITREYHLQEKCTNNGKECGSGIGFIEEEVQENTKNKKACMNKHSTNNFKGPAYASTYYLYYLTTKNIKHNTLSHTPTQISRSETEGESVRKTDKDNQFGGKFDILKNWGY